ncbi:hypothetical protein Tfer_2715 [Thermincola ferriacetica]|uniref:Uncharacterized protein n=1 Tax=Thermincola ferriacetica TaxID=281456 RepID=A0A0L6VZM4_9FIRM|nr:hypothetical protein [Thermincola ferriacetica]KNZ68720.1 hypothetical protein Tfer_2715 [Thermincola ferriacetica]
MRKFISLLLITLLVFSLVPVSLAANSQTSKTIYQAEEITDINELYNRALNGKTDKITYPKAKLKNKEGKPLNVKVYSTTQLLKIEKLKDGKEKKSYVTTTFAVVDEIELSSEKKSSNSRVKNRYFLNDYKYVEKWDPSKGVKAYQTVYWTVTSIGDDDYYDMYKVKGGWTVSSSYSVQNCKVNIGQNGFYNGGYTISQALTKYNVLIIYDYNVPPEWKPISKGMVGANSYGSVRKGTSSTTYDLWLENFIINDYSVEFPR